MLFSDKYDLVFVCIFQIYAILRNFSEPRYMVLAET